MTPSAVRTALPDLTPVPSGEPLLRDRVCVTVTYCATGDVVEAPLAVAASVPLEAAAPIRTLRSFKGQRNFVGEWWASTVSDLVGFESWVERDRLIELDFANDVVGIASQPFRLTVQDAGRRVEHTPDYFVRLADGTGVVIDVRPDELVDEAAQAVFAMSATFCESVGWRYRRLGAIAPVLGANLRWLAGYRHPRCADPSIENCARAVLSEHAVPLGELAQTIGNPVSVLPALFHMVWAGRASIDLDASILSMQSPVTYGLTKR